MKNRILAQGLEEKRSPRSRDGSPGQWPSACLRADRIDTSKSLGVEPKYRPQIGSLSDLISSASSASSAVKNLPVSRNLTNSP